MDFEKALTSRAQFDAFDETDVPSVFSDTVSAAFSMTRREELVDSSHRAFFAKNEERAKVIGRLGGDERIARNYGMFGLARERQRYSRELIGQNVNETPWYRTLDADERRSLDLILDFERRFPGVVKTDDELMDEFRAESEELRSDEQFTLERGGSFAAFLGTGGAIFTDPLVLATLPFGAEIGTGRTALQTIGRTAAVEGSIATAVEIPIQAEVMRFKRELDSPWSFKQSALNVLTAGAGGALLGGGIAGGVVGYRNALESYRAARDAGDATESAATREAEEILEDTVGLHDENPADGFDDLHERAFEDARAQHQNNRQVEPELEPFVEDDGINDAIRRSADAENLEAIDPREVEVDAELFQFKSGSDAAGVNDALRDVSRFDRRLAGVSLIWERADGTRFIADGHQRRALGVRAIEGGQDPSEVTLNGFVLREADGVTADDAVRIAAIKNIAEGTGSAVDAAKILRGVGRVGEAMMPPLPPRSALVRQAKGLAALGDDQFRQVINGVIDERFGALVGAATPNKKLQSAMIDVLARTDPANETQARSIIDQVRTAGIVNRQTEDLFGPNQVAESLYLERAQVLDAALREARKDKAVFGRLVSEESRIAETGQNQLDRAANQQRIQEANDAKNQIIRLANTKGPISDALTEAARAVKEGSDAAEGARAFLAAARRTILEGDRGGRQAGGAGSRRDTPSPSGHVNPTKGHPVRLSQIAPSERRAALVRMIEQQRDMSLERIFDAAERNQALLVRESQKIANELGEDVVLVDNGIKDLETAKAKLERKGYSGAGEMTDIVRLGFMVESPDLVVRIIDRLGDAFEVLDEGVSVTGMGYLDHKALVRFSDGRVGEVQIWEPNLKQAKDSAGQDLYSEIRDIRPEDLATDPAMAQRLEAATEASQELYAQAIANASEGWRRLAMQALPESMRSRVQSALDAGGGSAGAPGNVSRNAARDSSDPDSSISTGDARDQTSESSDTNRPSTPPSGVSRTTAGRASQLKNRSAIDAPPRSIVREVDDTRSATPDATRTGTVPDAEYDAVMSRAQELMDNQGELARVGNEINGELDTRSLSGQLESLDALEETLERVRACTMVERTVE